MEVEKQVETLKRIISIELNAKMWKTSFVTKIKIKIRKQHTSKLFISKGIKINYTYNVMKIVFVMSKSIAVWIRADKTSTVFANLAVPTNIDSSTLYSEFFIVFQCLLMFFNVFQCFSMFFNVFQCFSTFFSTFILGNG